MSLVPSIQNYHQTINAIAENFSDDENLISEIIEFIDCPEIEIESYNQFSSICERMGQYWWQLPHIRIRFKGVDDVGPRRIAEALKKYSSLKGLKIYVYDNDLGYEGAREIAEALKKNSSLKELNLRSNDIGAEGARAIAESLKTNLFLDFKLSANPLFS